METCRPLWIFFKYIEFLNLSGWLILFSYLFSLFIYLFIMFIYTIYLVLDSKSSFFE